MATFGGLMGYKGRGTELKYFFKNIPLTQRSLEFVYISVSHLMVEFPTYSVPRNLHERLTLLSLLLLPLQLFLHF